MLFSGDLAVFMQPRCCLVAVKSIFDGSKPNQIPPKGRAKVPPGTVEHPEGAESLAALTAGWPPCKKRGKNVVFFIRTSHSGQLPLIWCKANSKESDVPL